MTIAEIIDNSGISKYKISKISGIPNATLNNLYNDRTNILKCSSMTLYRLATTLNFSMEEMIKDEITRLEIEKSYEYGLPSYLQKDLDAYKDGLKNNSTLMDCLWGELYGSINCAEINDNLITHEHAEYLRDKFLRG